MMPATWLAIVANTFINYNINMKKLNVGCGRNILEGWVNLDSQNLSGVDICFDLESCRTNKIPIPDNSIEEFLLSHILEHIQDPLPLMQELHRIAVPNAICTVRVPYGSSDDAWEDPTHVRPYFMGSFGYFSQPFYWRADYGYRGDWQTQEILLNLKKENYQGMTTETILPYIYSCRNSVQEMVVTMKAIKPIRENRHELQTQPKISMTLI